MSTEAPPKHIPYGTAGFRDQAAVLDLVLYRVGVIAAMRSRAFNGQTIGVMITASHNPPQDNGAKLIDPYGDMLDQSWEARVSEAANAQSSATFDKLVLQMYEDFKIDKEANSNVIYGRDTRESGPRLSQRLKSGLDRAGARGEDVGMVTTPQLHYVVRALNTLGGPVNNPRGLESYGVPTQDGYYRKLATAMKAVFTPARVADAPIAITVDCANGVGALKLKEMAPLLGGLVNIEVVNGSYDKPDSLNHNCGADYVKTNQRLPQGIQPSSNTLYASFDGDADRIVFYFTDDNGFHLLDGDKIATLLAAFLRQTVANAGTKLDIGVVQTAYANGASTRYLEEKLDQPVVCTPTGVKHLHHAAQKFDIGIYFEANGHGTVLFADEATRKLRQMDLHTESEKRAVDTLLAMSDLINQTVGDAISDLLAVLAVVLVDHLTPQEWDAEYTDLPNCLMKVEVKDRSLFHTTNAERELVSPEGLQSDINRLVDATDRGRCFVRASGTENVVRIYAEAATLEAAQHMASNVKSIIQRQFGP